MDAPLCKICGSKHWGGAHVFKDAAATPAPAKPRALAASPKAPPSPTAKKRGRPRMAGPSQGKSARAEYQRDLMRKHRAKSKT